MKKMIFFNSQDREKKILFQKFICQLYEEFYLKFKNFILVDLIICLINFNVFIYLLN